VDAIGKLLGSYEAALRATGKLPPRLDGGADDGPSASATQQQNGGAAEGGHGEPDAASASGAEPLANGNGHGSDKAATISGGGGGGGAGLRPIELSEAQRRADEQERDGLTWVLHALAQHRAVTGDGEGALAASDEAMGRGPDIVELHSARSAILAAAGDVEGAGRGRRAAPAPRGPGRGTERARFL
jgi:hypothetical protein